MKAPLISAIFVTLAIFASHCHDTNTLQKNKHDQRHHVQEEKIRMKILFVTGNNQKFNQVQKWVHDLDSSIEIVRAECDLPEIQSLNIEEVITKKAQDAWLHLQAPLIVDDSGVYFESYPSFPGTFTKPLFKCLGYEGFWRLLKDNPRAWGLHTIAYTDGTRIELFQEKVYGTFVETTECKHEQPCVHLGCMFIAEGTTHTFTEIEEVDTLKVYHSRYVAVKKLVSWLKDQHTKS